MPAPPGSAIKGLILSQLPSHYRVQNFDLYLTALCAELSTAWGKWVSDAAWGNCVVVGAGVGGWAGVGAGGRFNKVGTVRMDPDAVINAMGWPSKQGYKAEFTQSQRKLILNISKVLDDKFSSWSKTVVFAGVGFVGTSTATPLSPGTFDARNVPTPLIACGVVPPISGVASALNDKLKTGEDGEPFNIDHQFARVKELTSAIGFGVQSSFSQIFLTTTMAAQNSVKGVASPGGVGSATSGSNGKLL